jgi:putative ABC transport system permease protein
MIKNYFKIAWRNIIRHKTYTAINVFGLAFGLCACIVIYLVTSYDLSFDKFHADKDRIYRIVGESQNAGGETRFMNSLTSDLAGIENEVPGFEKKTAFYDYGVPVSIPAENGELKKFDNRIADSYSSAAIITWPGYFDIFNYNWLAGNAASLNEPFKVVLTENRAKKFFGNIPVSTMIGKTVIYDDSLRVTVSGIVQDWTGNTDFGYTDFISISTATHSALKSRIATEDWNSLRPHSSMAFVKLSAGTTAATINKRLAGFVKQHVKFDAPGSKLTLSLQPLTAIHFTTDFHRGDDGDDFRKAYLPTLYALMGVALFILIIAVVNFINLSTAQSIQRAKEIGVRKVLGSNRINIIWQFLTETFVLTVFAVIISMLLANPFLYFFKDFVPAGVTINFFNPSTLIFLCIITLLTTLLAGFYPAKILSSYLPVLSLKGSAAHKGTEKVNLRKALIVFQFTISLIFIIAAIVVGRQINFMKYTDKGFNTDAIITLTKRKAFADKLKVFAENIRQIKGVDKIILQDHSPMGFAQMGNSFIYRDKQQKIIQSMLEIGNEDYIPFYKMKIIAGRNMLHSDSLQELVVNETMSTAMGFTNPQNAIGKILYMSGPVEKAYPVVGVIADFHQGSFHDAILPAVIANDPSYNHSVAIKLSASEKNTAAVKTILAAMEIKWKKLFPETDFDYRLMNESIALLYGQEEKTAWLVNAAMFITIFISCMGLFGLGMFTAQKRTKEIGIRKVLGAGVPDIAIMLSRDFITLIVIAIVIASPVAWYFMQQWLQDFTYKTTISWWIFGLAGIAAIGIAMVTISFQAIKAAMMNPVKSLRSE